ncbi:hypothetical protein K456DRAFT_56162 [Colletotrichum gloeosporioides 23]|nr:hypothetical protein K456DRAFT_56162 [Colletotrichum gloeosporioides 23]
MPLPSFLLWQTTTLYWPKGAGFAITPSAFALSHLRTLRKPHFPRLAVFGLSTMTPLLHRMRGYLSSSVFPSFFSRSPRTLSFAWIFRDRQNLGKGNTDADSSAYDMDSNHEIHGTENETHARSVEPTGPARHRCRLIEIRLLQDEIHQPCCY